MEKMYFSLWKINAALFLLDQAQNWNSMWLDPLKTFSCSQILHSLIPMWQQGLLAPGALSAHKKSFLVIIVIIFHLVKWLYCPSRLKGHILCSPPKSSWNRADTAAKYKLLFLVVWGSGWAVEVGKGLLDCHFGKCGYGSWSECKSGVRISMLS